MTQEQSEDGLVTKAWERRSHLWDRAVVIAMALVTAVLSTYYTNVVSMGQVQSDLRVHTNDIKRLEALHLNDVLAFGKESSELKIKVEDLRLDRRGDDEKTIEILRRLSEIEKNQSELMRMLSQLLQKK